MPTPKPRDNRGDWACNLPPFDLGFDSPKKEKINNISEPSQPYCLKPVELAKHFGSDVNWTLEEEREVWELCTSEGKVAASSTINRRQSCMKGNSKGRSNSHGKHDWVR